ADLVREVADQLAIDFLLLELPRFARDLQLLVDPPEFEHERGTGRIDRRGRAREVQAAPARRLERELLLGAGRTRRRRAFDELVESWRAPEHGIERLPAK